MDRLESEMDTVGAGTPYYFRIVRTAFDKDATS
jgi:hypothetical protein